MATGIKPPLPVISVFQWIKLLLFSDVLVVPYLISDRLEIMDAWFRAYKFPVVELPWVFAALFFGLFSAWITIGTTLDRVEKRFLFTTPVEVMDKNGKIFFAQGEVYMQQKAFEEITTRANVK